MKNFKWQVIIDWFRENGRHDFSWRDYSYPIGTLLYRVWLAEILLQQTQADRIVPFYDRILESYPDIHHLAKASYEGFFPYYQGLGYYSRARNLLKTAKIVSEEYGGIFPEDMAKLKKLPGVGEYTARAILAFGYGESLLAWDTNLETIFARYYNGSKYEKLSLGQKGEIEKNVQEFLAKNENEDPKKAIRDVNNGLMDWARMMEPKNALLLDKNTYIFSEGRFAVSEGVLEPVIKRQSLSFPIPDATIIVVLHRDHKVYYSSDRTTYSPFTLPPALHRNTRQYVQDFFRERYSLELSVRPVHKKWLSQEGKPYIAVNAQIQVGKANFGEFSKKEMELFFSNSLELI